MSVEILDSIKKQTADLTTQEKIVLANYLLEQMKDTVENGNPNNEIRQKRMAWLKANREKYGGQYVVLDGDKLLGTAKTFPEGKQLAARAGVPDAFVNYLSKPNEEGYVGGW